MQKRVVLLVCVFLCMGNMLMHAMQRKAGCLQLVIKKSDRGTSPQDLDTAKRRLARTRSINSRDSDTSAHLRKARVRAASCPRDTKGVR